MEVGKNYVAFTAVENKIRKRWLAWSILLPGFVSVSILIILLIKIVASGSFFSKDMGAALLWVLFSGGGLYISYHCAYKKPGTVLLLLGMIGISLNLVLDLFKVISLLVIKAPVVLFVPLLAMVSFDIVIFYYSFKLRKANKSYKKRSGHVDSVHD